MAGMTVLGEGRRVKKAVLDLHILPFPTVTYSLFVCPWWINVLDVNCPRSPLEPGGCSDGNLCNSARSLFPVNCCIPISPGLGAFLSISKLEVTWFCLPQHSESNNEKCNGVTALWRARIRIEDPKKTAREFVGSFYLPGGWEGGRVEGISQWVKSLYSCLPASLCLLKKKKSQNWLLDKIMPFPAWHWSSLSSSGLFVQIFHCTLRNVWYLDTLYLFSFLPIELPCGFPWMSISLDFYGNWNASEGCCTLVFICSKGMLSWSFVFKYFSWLLLLNSSLTKQKTKKILQQNILKDTDYVGLFPQEILGFCYCTFCVVLGLF